jgi:hypothetical protein
MKTQPTQPIKITKAAPVKTTIVHHTAEPSILFGKENYKWMVIGVIVLALGFFLMAGGKSADPNVFNDKDIYSPIRITIAPILIVGGLIIEIFAIMKKPK